MDGQGKAVKRQLKGTGRARKCSVSTADHQDRRAVRANGGAAGAAGHLKAMQGSGRQWTVMVGQ